MNSPKTTNTLNETFPSQARGSATIAFLLKWAPYLIVAITGLIYTRSLFNDFVSFDDFPFIVNNKAIRDISLQGIVKIFTTFNTGKYQPFTTLSFALEHHFFGLNPVAYHLTNIILHLLSTFVLFKIAERLSGSRITAIVVALLFGIHPMHVEEVAWASERKDMMYAFFYLCSIYTYLRYIDSGYRIKYYIATFLLFLVSLFSKTEAITLPLVLLLIDVYKSRKIDHKAILEKLPLFAFSFFIGTLGYMSQQVSGFRIEQQITIYGFINRIFLATSIPAFYIVRLVVPFSLSAEHYYPDMHNGLLPWMYYASLPFLLLLAWLVFRRSTLRKEIIFGSVFFLALIAFMPQIIFTGPAITPERYTYLSYIGLFYIAGQWLTRNWSAKSKKPLLVVCSGFAIIFCLLTWQRIAVWNNGIALYTDIIEKNADIHDLSYFYWSRGNDHAREGDMPAAIADYNQVIAVLPTSTEVYQTLGRAYFKTGDFKDAITDFNMALHLSPEISLNYYNRAAAKASYGDINGALSDFNTFLLASPNDAPGYAGRAMARLTLKDSTGAYQDLKKAAELGNKEAPQLIQQYFH